MTRAHLSRGEEQASARTQLLANILMTSVDAILALDVHGRILSWNHGAQLIFGWQEDEVLGKDVALIVPPELMASGQMERIRAAVERHGYWREARTERLTKDGRRIVVDITATVLRDSDGNVVGRSAIVRDITGWEEMKEELYRARQLAAMGELAASVAHEIRNPLAGMSGAIQILRDQFPPRDPRREVLAEVLAQVGRLDETVRDLLLFARPQRPALQLVEVLPFLRDLVGRQQKTAEGFHVDVDAGPACLRCEMDRGLMEQVFGNLVINAMHAANGQGRLRISVERSGKFMEFTFEDDGPGIPPEVHGRIFQPFFTTKPRGTGLGLAISRKIVQAHGGHIRLMPREGSGARFQIRLPVDPEDAS